MNQTITGDATAPTTCGVSAEKGNPSGEKALPADAVSVHHKNDRSQSRADNLPAFRVYTDKLFIEINALHLLLEGSVVMSSSHLDIVCAISLKLCEVRRILGRSEFEQILKSGEKARFSWTSAMGYMLIFEHSAAVRAAGLINLKEAHFLAWHLSREASSEKRPEFKESTPSAAALVFLIERRILKEMRHLSETDQAAFLADLAGKLTRLHRMFT